ncbi:hypothetical protein B0H19DRAFT_1300867 [Mycena capillaripes]|nr:hypothetical protein B0H19DRAFT_1300867 [Mycena capillaripes]
MHPPFNATESYNTTRSNTQDSSNSEEIIKIDSDITLLTSNGRRISMRGWNVSGPLATNLSDPTFLSELENYEINLFQETHLLLASQELTLPLPHGSMFAVAREPSTATFERPWGEVLAIVRKDLDAAWDQLLSGPDLLAWKLGSLCLFNAYVLPHGSPWTQWSPIRPIEKLQQSMAVERLRDMSSATSTGKQAADTSLPMRIPLASR